ncbi:LexA family transcriptional regulator [Pseudochrobactrum asaccharolyticum]|nr:LexA family transcriptional regulator [Pseudochrobactrum asaccharolyticum]
MEMQDAHKRLRQARLNAGFKSASAAARAMGVNPITYTAHENGGRGINAEAAKHYAKHLGIDPVVLIFNSTDDTEGSEEQGLVQYKKTKEQNDLATDLQLDMPNEFLSQRFRIPEDSSRIIEVVGDYMYDPTDPSAVGSLLPGDCVVVDTSDTRPSPPGAFAVFDGAGVSLKMLEVIPNSEPKTLRITGRNPRYDCFERAMEAVEIIGRVKAKVSML